MKIHTTFNSTPLNPIPNQINPGHTVTANLLKIKCNTILPSRPEFPVRCSCFQTKMIRSYITHLLTCPVISLSLFSYNPLILSLTSSATSDTFLKNSISIPSLTHNFYELLNLLHLPSCKNSPLCHFLCIRFK
jgi:hypothetical protein